MRQTLVMKPKLDVQMNANPAKIQSLQILSFSNEQLKRYLQEKLLYNPYLKSTKNEDYDYGGYSCNTKSIYEEIMEQARYSKYEPDVKVCEYFLSQIDGNGYFKVDYPTLVKQSGYPVETIKRNLAIVRTFEPYGIFAFDLKQCLKIQSKLSQEPESSIGFILCDYLSELATRQYGKVSELSGLSVDEVKTGFQFIQSLNPKPCANYNQDTVYLQPELKISLVDDKLMIEVLESDISITLDTTCENGSKELQEAMKSYRAEASFILNSIQKRNMTLLQIMEYICDVQKGFFFHNEKKHYLTLKMIAENCGLHISTICRAISNKAFEWNGRYYVIGDMLCNDGVKNVSSEEIMMEIKEILSKENPCKPYSDQKIQMLLNEIGIVVSRRTVTKYREKMHIFSSVDRKRMYQNIPN